MSGVPVRPRIGLGGIETLTDSPGSYENRGMALLRDQGDCLDFVSNFELMKVPCDKALSNTPQIALNSWLDERDWYLVRAEITYNATGEGSKEEFSIFGRLRIAGDLYIPRQNLVNVLDIEISEAQR